jgi:hypothetical protein
MIISDKQLQFLYQVLMDSLCIVGASTPFKFGQELRIQMADEIYRQQSDKLRDIKDDNQ